MLYISVLYIDYLFDMLCISYTQKYELFWFLVGGNHRPKNTNSINGINSIVMSMVDMFILSNETKEGIRHVVSIVKVGCRSWQTTS